LHTPQADHTEEVLDVVLGMPLGKQNRFDQHHPETLKRIAGHKRTWPEIGGPSGFAQNSAR